MREALRVVGLYLLASVICAALLLGTAFPHHPHTVLGWILLVFLSFPLWLVGELVGAYAFRNRFAQAIESRSDGVGFWFVRFLYLLLIALLAFAASWAVIYALGFAHL